MALDIDGFAVFKVIASHPAVFPEIELEVGKTARALIVKQIKHKTADLKKMRDVYGVLGESTFKLIIDGIPDAQIKTIVTRIDKNHPDIKKETSQWRRQQLIALLDGSKEPAPKEAKKPAKRTAAKKKESSPMDVPEVLEYSSAGARRKR
jgi:hypothetical protein